MNAAQAALERDASAPLQASASRVDVWVCRLDSRAGEADVATLSDAERAFASRLRVGRARWIAARAALRVLLGRYLGLAPSRVAFEVSPGGKPRLEPGRDREIRFNLSHSDAIALVAVRLAHEVGVDVERVRPGVDVEAIRRHVLGVPVCIPSPGARNSGDPEVFFRDWVRREALTKAAGRGIVAAPDAAARWSVRDLPLLPGYAAAIASVGDGWCLSFAEMRGRALVIAG